MRRVTTFITTLALTAGFGATAFASSPDVYVVNFRNSTDANSQALDAQLSSAIAIAGVNTEEVVIDTSSAAKWEKAAHDAFDRDIVPVFNQWVGLPGFAAVVDAKSKRVIGCVNGRFSANEIADELRKMSSRASGKAFMSKASVSTKTTKCPPVFNKDPG